MLLERGDGVVADELGAARGDHDGIDDDVFRAVFPQLPRDDLDQSGGRDHADLDRVRADVGKNAVELLGEEIRRYLKDSLDAGGILGGQGGDGAHGVNAVCGHGLDVGLNSGASAGIASSDR